MKKSIYIFLIICFVTLLDTSLKAHPVHISVTNIDILPQKNKIVFSVRLFISDFNTIINKKNKSTIDFSKSPQLKIIRYYVENYISQHLIFNIPRTVLKKIHLLRYKSNNKDAVWFYFEIPLVSCNFKSISIKNTLLNDLYKDQTNLLILSKQKQQWAYRYTIKATNNRFSIN